MASASKCDNSDNYNPKLDFFSDLFDPLLALNTPNLKVPIPNAKRYDNLAMYKSAQDRKNITIPEKKKDKPKPSTSQGQQFERRWLPHQLPVKVERHRAEKNVLTRMESTEGPLKLLRICKDNRFKIKVWIRNSHTIRGYCIGHLVAFDKHWNLAMENVEEVWIRKKCPKIPALDSYDNIMKSLPDLPFPQIEIIKSDKKTETCRRYIDQFMIRGEHIAILAVIKNTSKKDE